MRNIQKVRFPKVGIGSKGPFDPKPMVNLEIQLFLLPLRFNVTGEFHCSVNISKLFLKKTGLPSFFDFIAAKKMRCLLFFKFENSYNNPITHNPIPQLKG